VADDQAIVRAGFRLLIDSEPDLKVLGEAANGAEAVAVASRTSPDVVLMDIRMPVLDGIEATRQIVASGPLPRVHILTTFDLDEYVFGALQAGASGFLLKDVRPEELVAGIRTVADGESLLAPTVTTRLIANFRNRETHRPVPPGIGNLTPREREIFDLLARGNSNAQIATQLTISRATVKTYVTRILGKLGLTDRVQAVVLGYETGMIRPGDRSLPRHQAGVQTAPANARQEATDALRRDHHQRSGWHLQNTMAAQIVPFCRPQLIDAVRSAAAPNAGVCALVRTSRSRWA
jgi:DNA-binding NarL/FixJ family response regulator